MRTTIALACALALLAASATVAVATAPAARQADPAVFGGLGTWIDIYDTRLYRTPARTAAQIAARGVDTVWLETANYRSATDVVEPVGLGRLVDALRARGLRTVAWYLPGHVNEARDLRRARAMIEFRTPKGASFDGIALDIEATALKDVALRSKRAVTLTRRVRAAAGDLPLAIVPFNPRGLERNAAVWPRFPWAELARHADAFAPMIYTGGAMTGFDATYGYVARALRLVRTLTKRDDIPIHAAGGVADRLGPDELAGFAAAVRDDGGTIGYSLYDWLTTPPTAWGALAKARA